MTVNRLATPLPDSVLDRYYAANPDEVDHRKKHAAKTASETKTSEAAKAAPLDEDDFQRVFDI